MTVHLCTVCGMVADEHYNPNREGETGLPACCAGCPCGSGGTRPIRALTLHQPWAELIASGRKTIETRPMMPPKRLLGDGGFTLLVHAGQTVDYAMADWFRTQGALDVTSEDLWRTKGRIVAVAYVERAFRDGQAVGMWRQAIDEQAAGNFGNFGPGRCYWMLTQVRPVHLLDRVRGMPGLFIPDDLIVARVQAALPDWSW